MNNILDKEIDNILFDAIEEAGTWTHKLTAEKADYIQAKTKSKLISLIANREKQMLEFVIKEVEKSIMVIISTGASDVWMSKEKYQIESDLRAAQNKKVKRILKDLRQRAKEWRGRENKS